ncbi:30S ribosomal protein S16 [Membranihabitans maritimus]|uniref:30S ribosomal protein S16 n=1 Tax=Membranihabitans maritimus TaxID=2904244 RepID=UPI00272ED010|nr:30S ribosomal protein S16 [Membranihabitans maritimus]
MAVKIRLQRKGRKKKPFYHIVIADVRSPRDGKFIEKIGTYNPMTKPATIDLDRDKAFEWMEKGAQPTDTVRAILKFKGVLYKRHLMRGVRKGAFTEEKALEMWTDFVSKKEEKVATRFEESAQEKRDRLISIFGKAPEKETPVEEASVESSEETSVSSEEE